MHIPAIIKILIVFLGVLTLSRVRVPLGLALILGGGCLDLWAGRSPGVLGPDLVAAMLRPEVWLLMLNITLIIEFGHFMAAEDNARAIIGAARRFGGRHGHAVSLVLIPAAIGLVPMPGGALFSAPLIGRTVEPHARAAWKAAVNYWFRHVLEYWWPLYPVVIVTLSIFTIETWKFMAVQIPFTAISITAGYLVLLRGHSGALSGTEPEEQPSPRLFRVLLPIMVCVAAALLLPGPIRSLLPESGPTVWKLLAMLAGLIGGLLLINLGQQDSRKPFSYLLTGKTANVLTTLAGVMIFQALLESSGLLPAAGHELAESQVPVALIVAILPFLAGLVTGIAVGFAGTAFPIVVGFLSVSSTGLSPLAALVLAFTMGYAGMMLSPVHLCFVLTREYFSAPAPGVYRHLVPCVLAVMGYGTGMYWILQALGL